MSSNKPDPHADDPLPPGWLRQYSRSQKRNFYFHKETKHTQWHFPTASEAKDPLKAKQRADANRERELKKQKDAPPPVERDRKKPPASSLSSPADENPAAKRPRTDDFLDLDKTSVAIIVPFRDIHAAQKRSEHLKAFIPHMMRFLGRLQNQLNLISDYHVYIIEQSDDQRKFNRGKLLNIGFDLARKSGRKHDVFIFHDVDLLPQDDLSSWYAMFPKRPIHIARVWGRYSNNPKYFGGVVSFSSSDFKRINGYPNNYFGWGGEDDEMQRRLERLGIQFDYPNQGTLVDLEDMTLDEKLQFLRANKSWKCMVKWELEAEHEQTWKTNGLADLKYSLIETKDLHESKKATKSTVDVKLNGSHWTNAKAGIDYAG